MDKRTRKERREPAPLTTLADKLRTTFPEGGHPELLNAATLFLCVLAAKKGEFSTLTRQENVLAALLLNRTDWLAEMECTLVDAICLIDPRYLAVMPAVLVVFKAHYGARWRDTCFT